jgi:hypothetical protein
MFGTVPTFTPVTSEYVMNCALRGTYVSTLDYSGREDPGNLERDLCDVLNDLAAES